MAHATTNNGITSSQFCLPPTHEPYQPGVPVLKDDRTRLR